MTGDPIIREIRSVSPASVARIAGLLYGLGGLFGGLVFALMSTTMGATIHELGGFAGFLFGGGAIILLPIFYGVAGAVFGAIAAAIYNVVAGRVGGIQLQLTEANSARF